MAFSAADRAADVGLVFRAFEISLTKVDYVNFMPPGQVGRGTMPEGYSP